MKVVLFSLSLNNGGAERRASVFANYFASKNIPTSLVTMTRGEKEYTLGKNVNRISVFESYDSYLKHSRICRIKMLREVLKKEKPSLIIAFIPTFAFYACLATKLCKELKKVPVVYAVTLYQKKYKLKERVYNLASCVLSDKILLQCKEQTKNNRLFKKKCVVSYNPIADSFKNIGERDYTYLHVMSVGRFVKHKCFDKTIEAVVNVHKIKPNISLDIYGQGPLKDKWQRLIIEKEAESYIKLKGFSENIFEEYKNHNCFVLSSQFEGFPNALAEAMMAGLVCVSKACPTGPKEMIYNGQNGYLFNHRNELESVLISLIGDNETCKRIAKEARNKATTEFEQDVVLNSLIDKLI